MGLCHIGRERHVEVGIRVELQSVTLCRAGLREEAACQNVPFGFKVHEGGVDFIERSVFFAVHRFGSHLCVLIVDHAGNAAGVDQVGIVQPRRSFGDFCGKSLLVIGGSDELEFPRQIVARTGMVSVHVSVFVCAEISARNSVVGTEQAFGRTDTEQALGKINFFEAIGRAVAAGRHVGIPSTQVL